MAEAARSRGLTRRQATGALLAASVVAAVPGLAAAGRPPADEAALRSAAEFAMSF